VIVFVVTNLNLLLNSVDDSNNTTVMEQKNEMAMGVTWAKSNTSRMGNGSSVNGSVPVNGRTPNRDLVHGRDPNPDLPNADLPQNPSGPNASYIVDFIHNINAAQKV
jgi:hypothetical protein